MLLHDQAWAVGRRVRELVLGEVRIKAIHRGEQSLEPRPELRLAAGDRLVLFGNAVAMERAEQRLLEGH
ncbi:TrkA-C domain protein [compost metagenome]